MKKVRSRQPAISALNWVKQFFPVSIDKQNIKLPLKCFPITSFTYFCSVLCLLGGHIE